MTSLHDSIYTIRKPDVFTDRFGYRLYPLINIVVVSFEDIVNRAVHRYVDQKPLLFRLRILFFEQMKSTNRRKTLLNNVKGSFQIFGYLR